MEIDPQKDLVKGANSAFFGVDSYVVADNVRIEPIHTPLVCFGEPKVYRNNTQEFKLPKNGKIYFNLFNNMWGTGSPQWLQGNYRFEFDIIF